MDDIKLNIKYFDCKSEYGKILWTIMDSKVGYEKIQEVKCYIDYYLEAIPIEEWISLSQYPSLVMISLGDDCVVFSGTPEEVMDEMKGIRLAMLVIEGVEKVNESQRF